MGQPVVHFEIIGRNPDELQSFYGGLFAWEFDTSAPVADAVSEPSRYGFTVNKSPEGIGIPGGVGGGAAFGGRVIFYVGVPDVEAALEKAERLGGKRVMGPARNPGKGIVVGHFTDPQGNLLGVAGPK
jgi:hypothetical protein